MKRSIKVNILALFWVTGGSSLNDVFIFWLRNFHSVEITAAATKVITLP